MDQRAVFAAAMSHDSPVKTVKFGTHKKVLIISSSLLIDLQLCLHSNEHLILLSLRMMAFSSVQFQRP